MPSSRTLHNVTVRRLWHLVLVALLCTGCIGAIPRDEFQAELRARGGGLEQSLVVEALNQVAGTVGTADFQITSLTATPSSGVITLEVRDPRSPEQLDTYTVRHGSISRVDPVRVSASDDLDADAFDVTSLAFDRLNDMVDDALLQFGVFGGYVTTMSVRLSPVPDEPGELRPHFFFTLESDRSSALAVFAADGAFLRVDVR